MSSEKQNVKTLPVSEARSLLLELMHQGYDTFCTEEKEGKLLVIWPASVK